MESFKAEGITELVLDLRYNGGGSVASAINLASMIAPSSAINQVFIKRIYNDKLQEELLNDPDYGEEFLQDKLVSLALGTSGDGVAGTSLPNLNLSRLYVIGLRNTASARELIINGLKPYMNVITVGGNTHGKYTASITLQHPDSQYSNWAIQPIVFKSANASNQSDYWNGFSADIQVTDNPSSGDFGYDANSNSYEELLAAAINDITGLPNKNVKRSKNDLGEFKNIRYFEKLDRKDMIYDKNFSLPIK
jgi:C-terminal processing protease CtpA/Prc